MRSLLPIATLALCLTTACGDDKSSSTTAPTYEMSNGTDTLTGTIVGDVKKP